MNVTRSAPLLILAVALTAGCTQQVKIESSGGPGGQAKASDPWPTAVGDLRKSPDAATCRRVLPQLNSDLTGNPAAAPPPLAEDEAKRLAATLRLNEDEQKELAGSSYTGLDAAYLADALFLRDSARSLDVAGLPPERQAAAGFAWVCRQVYLRQWEATAPDGRRGVAPPVPPTAVLRRGFGTGLERAYVYLALLQQLGLDGCLVGPPGQEQAATQTVKDGKVTNGPFWAVGVRAGDDVLLFDPWRSIPFPGPTGPGVGTLGQLKKNPDQVKTWREDKAQPWAVPPKDVADAVVYVAVPLSAVTPRMKRLETECATGLGVKLAADPKVAADRFAKGPAAAAVWAPPTTVEHFDYARALAWYLPKSDGGLSGGDLRLPEQLEKDLLPKSLGAPPPGVEHPEAVQRLSVAPQYAYHTELIAPGYREKIQRGRFDEASRALVAVEARFAAAEQRSRDDDSEAVRKWVARLNDVYKQLSTARLSGNRGETQDAEDAVREFWKQEQAGAMIVIEKALAVTARAEAAFLYALCKHEQAEKKQTQLERVAAAIASARSAREKAEAEAARDTATDEARTAWVAAKDAWDRYLPSVDKQASAFPGRAEHVRRLAARAAAMAAPVASK